MMQSWRIRGQPGGRDRAHRLAPLLLLRKGEARLALSYPLCPVFPIVIARSKSSKRRSNPLNRVAQENPGHGHPRNPKGVATSCLTALLAMTAGETTARWGRGMPRPYGGDQGCAHKRRGRASTGARPYKKTGKMASSPRRHRFSQ